MNKNCKKCGSDISELNFTDEQKLEIYGLMQQDLKLFAIKKITDDFKLSNEEAKIIVAHLNNKNGKCSSCEYSELENENVECPECQTFNYNLIEPPFNMLFCSHLEWGLDFENVGLERVKRFWCDGIEHFPKDFKSLSIKNIVKNKEIITKAWIGDDGQDIYEMKIKFGEKSIGNYKKGLDLIDCIPKNENYNWIKIDCENKRITVELK